MNDGRGRPVLPGAKVVAIGGGTGLPIVLRSVRDTASEVCAVVTTADDGGSSGRLRREFGVLPPGDIRNCLVALAPDSSLAAELFQYRFVQGEGLVGHSVGNLLITALTQMTGDFLSAIRQAEKLVGSRGHVLPSTLDEVTLHAEVANGDAISGQWKIARTRELKKVRIEPADARACGDTVVAIADADMIVVGPGSLFTSIMPNLLVRGIADALKNARGRRVFISNVANQRGETEGFTVSDHLRAIGEHLGEVPFDVLLVNDKAPELVDETLEPGVIVERDGEAGRFAVEVISADLVDDVNPLHHDPKKLASVLGRVS